MMYVNLLFHVRIVLYTKEIVNLFLSPSSMTNVTKRLRFVRITILIHSTIFYYYKLLHKPSLVGIIMNYSAQEIGGSKSQLLDSVPIHVII